MDVTGLGAKMARVTLAAGLVGVVLVALVGAPASAGPGQGGAGMICGNRSAVAFHPGVIGTSTPSPLRPQPRPAPVSCGGSTGYAGVESRIAASAAGVVFSPATAPDGTTGVAFSRDHGVHWTATGTNGGIDDNLYVDPATGRIFWLTLNGDPHNPANHEVSFSDDGGRTWRVSTTGACCVEGENSRIVAAPAPPGSPWPTGYPDVVYLCSDSSLVGGAAYPAGARVCSRSLDGGMTFGIPAPLFTKPVPQHLQCAPYGGEYFAASEGAYPEAGPHGSLYVLVHCGSDHVAVTYLGVSHDEAATWQLVSCPGSSGPVEIPNADELRVDGSGNLYAGLTATTKIPGPIGFDDIPVLQVSTDGGCHWGKPIAVTPPGVVAHSHHPETDAFQTGLPAPYWPQPLTDYSWFMDVGRLGQVAFNFYGTTDMTGKHWDAYVSETRDALDASPTFWAVPVNPVSKNMGAGAYADEYSSGNEHVGLSFGPDGTVWASFTDGTDGYAGHFNFPQSG